MTIRVYDLARELKQDTKRIIEDLRREGADISVPSNSVSHELAKKIRSKYFPKVEATPRQKLTVVKRKSTVDNSTNNFLLEERKVNMVKTQPQVEGKNPESSLVAVESRIIDELKVNCRECLRPTKHSLIHSVEIKEIERNEKYQIVQCMGCESLSFRRITFDNNQSSDREEIHLYPSRIKGRQKLNLGFIPPIIAQIIMNPKI